jgi:hypothetical protein
VDGSAAVSHGILGRDVRSVCDRLFKWTGWQGSARRMLARY